MTYLDLIELVKSKAPADLTLEEAEAVRAQLQERPHLYSALGGREWVESYLAALPTAADRPVAPPTDSATNLAEPDADATMASGAPGRSWPWVVLGLLLLLTGAVYGIYVNRSGSQATLPPTKIAQKQGGTPEANAKASATKDVVAVSKAVPDEPETPNWKGWTYAGDSGAEIIPQHFWDIATDPTKPVPIAALLTGRRKVVLSQDCDVTAADSWLVMQIGNMAQASEPGGIEVRTDGRPIARFDLPRLTTELTEFALPLAAPHGRRTKFEVAYVPSGQEERIVWRSLKPARALPAASGRVVVVKRLDTPTDPPLADNVVPLIPSPQPLFEDEGVFAPLDPSPTGSATLAHQDKYSGAAAIRIAPSGRFRRDIPGGIVIAENPAPNQFRYLRFAVRIPAGRATLVLDHKGDALAGYELGKRGTAPLAFPGALEIPTGTAGDGWVLVTRDLFSDFGEIELTGIVFEKLDSEPVLFDHIYLARTLAHLDRATPPPAEPPARHLGPAEPISPGAENIEHRVVAVHFGDHVATGTIVDKHGIVLTAGHLLTCPAKEIVVHFWDGKREPGKVLGIRRDFNIGLVQITGRRRYWPYARMAKASNFGARRDYVAFSHRLAFQSGQAPETIYIPSSTPFFGYAQVGNAQWEFAAGGPVFEPGGELIGIHTGPRRGAMGYLEIEYVTMHWNQLVAGQQEGHWDQYQRSVLGVSVQGSAGAIKVDAIDPQWPAARCGLQKDDLITRVNGQALDAEGLKSYALQRDPGAELALDVRRGDATLKITLPLGRRP